MGRATVRAAMLSFLTGIEGITTLYKDAPYEMLEDNWRDQGTNLPGTPAFLHINSNSETRVTLPAVHGGQKEVIYDVSLVLLYQYIIPPDPGPDGLSAWVDGLDTLLDNVIDRIRSDPAFGSGPNGPIWQAGEDNNDISIHSDLPVEASQGGVLMAWNRVDFKVVEIVVA